MLLKTIHLLLFFSRVCLAGRKSDQVQVLFQGRVFKDEYLRHALSWPFSKAIVTFEGSSQVSAWLEDSGFDTSEPQTSVSFSAGNLKDFEVAREDSRLKLTLKGLDPKSTTQAVLTKLSESDDGEVLLYYFEVDAQGSFLPSTPISASDRRLEVIGDSISVGYGNLGDIEDNNLSNICLPHACGGKSCQITDASKSFAALVAEQLQAQVHVTAWSATGMTNARHGADPSIPNVGEFYEWFDGKQRGHQFDFSLFMPQVIIQAAGLNDFRVSKPPPDVHTWASVYVEFLQKLVNLYPGVRIVMLQYPASALTAVAEYESETFLDTAQQYATYDSYMQQTHIAAQEAGLENVLYHRLSEGTGSEPRQHGCVGHPSIAGHKAMAVELIHVLGQVMGWEHPLHHRSPTS